MRRRAEKVGHVVARDQRQVNSPILRRWARTDSQVTVNPLRSTQVARCNICGSAITLVKKYNEHVPDSRTKTFLKHLIPYFDVLIPSSIPRLKRLSRRPSIFRGYIKICSTCGHGEMVNPPTEHDLRTYYQDQYWGQRHTTVERAASNDADYLVDPRAIHQVAFVMEEIRCDSIGNMLEIGAGAAYASLLLRARCQESAIALYACEPGQQWEDYYQRQGIEKTADYFPFETDERFDYVHTSHWLEHARSLGETLSELHKMINPLGYLFIEVPNTEHFYWELPGGDTPHVQFFTRESLVSVLNGHSFECVKIGEYGITRADRRDGVCVTADRYGACEKGFWIRGLFRRTS
jgi:SAM-dependent methyltransferase